MLSFVNDYSEGAHEKILERLVETNRESLSGYGTDKYSDSAKEKIRQACNCPDADVYFLVGGTQTNQTVIDAVLNQYEGVAVSYTHLDVYKRQVYPHTITLKEGLMEAATWYALHEKEVDKKMYIKYIDENFIMNEKMCIRDRYYTNHVLWRNS